MSIKNTSSSSQRDSGVDLVPYLGFLVFVVIEVARRSGIITDAQFWAEDGAVWYSDAYHSGWISLTQQHSGYFQTISRLTMLFAQYVPLQYAPLFSNIIAIVIRAAIAAFILSRRHKYVKLMPRILIGLYIGLMPGIAEVHVNITNTHWYLALYCFLVIVACKPQSSFWKIHDVIVVVLCGLSGPFIIFLVPAAILAVRNGAISASAFWRQALRSHLLLLTIALAAVQFLTIILTATANRLIAPLGASWGLFVRIIASRVFGGFVLPDWETPAIGDSLGMSIAIFAIGTAVLLFVISKANWRVWALISFLALLTASALSSPIISLSQPQWPLMIGTPGQRYFVLTSIGVFILAIYALAYLPGRIRSTAFAVFGVYFVVLAVTVFEIPPLPHEPFAEAVQKFDSAHPGAQIVIPITPDGWQMALNKK